MNVRQIDEYLHVLHGLLKNESKQEYAEFSLRDDIFTLKDLRVAAVMDKFTFHCFKPECELLHLSANNYINEILEFKPDLLFIESAWEGIDYSWREKVAPCDEDITKLALFCKNKGIPIILWNKEDPVHTSQFIKIARLCDFVFTTEADVVNQYKLILGHNRVYHLHFGAQPSIHNPIEKYERKHKICFAGSYYEKYAERCEIFSKYVTLFERTCGIDIYDRNLNKPDNIHQFPKRYKDYIVGTLPPDKIDVAYKGYDYGLNLSSVTKTQTMFGRRVFELCASNTLVFSNYTTGIKNYFGDLVICTNDLDQATARYDALERCNGFGKLRLLALRKVLSEHLYEDRLERIVNIVFGKSLKTKLPKVVIINGGTTPEEKSRIRWMFSKQSYENKVLIDVCEYHNIVDESCYVGLFVPSDYYGTNYILDLVLSLRYSNKDGYVKPSEIADAYRFCEIAPLRKSIVSARIISNQEIFPENALQDVVFNGEFLNIDFYNYKQNYCGNECEEVDDLQLENQGLPLEELEETRFDYNCYDNISADDMYTHQENIAIKDYKCSVVEDSFIVDTYSSVAPVYVELTKKTPLKMYNIAGTMSINMLIDGDCEYTEGVVWFYAKGCRTTIGTAFFDINRDVIVKVPSTANRFAVGIRVAGVQNTCIKELTIKTLPTCDNKLFAKLTEAIVITDKYPLWNKPDRNSIIHKHVCENRANGGSCNVVSFDPKMPLGRYELDGVEVYNCHSNQIDNVLSQVNTVCIYYLLPEIWDDLKKHLDHLRLIVWMEAAIDTNNVGSKDHKGTDITNIKKSFGEVFEYAKDYDIQFVCGCENTMNSIKNEFGDLVDETSIKRLDSPLNLL